MAEKKNPLTVIANSSAGLATAIAQKNLPKNEVSQIEAMVQLNKTHNELTALPQKDAYKKFLSMDKTTRDALTSMYSPKYSKEDRGFVGNMFNSIKSAVYYGGGTTVDLAKNLGKLTPMGAIETVTEGAGAALKGLVNEFSKTEAGEKAFAPIEKGMELLVRPQEKLVKQPYMAARLQTGAEGGNFFSAFGTFAAEGFKELLPGGEDALPTDNSTSFKQYWERASDPTKVFDEKAVSRFIDDLSPAAAYVGRLLASKQDLVENFDQYQDNPGVMDLINRYVSGEETAIVEVANSVARFEKSKISPGRDYARQIIEMLPHEYEKAIMGDGAAKALFTTLSAPIDLSVTFAADPLIIGGKVRRGLLVAKYGFFKVGEGAIPLEKAFTLPKVRAYWDEAGKLIDLYRNGDLATKGAALNRLQDRFREININVVQDLANAGVKNADDALEYFDNGRRFIDIMSGGLGVAGKYTLIPRMTLVRSQTDNVKDLVTKTLGTERYSAMAPSKNVKDFVNKFESDPIAWTEKVGFEKTGVIFTAKDKSQAARIDRVVRVFAIAPAQQRAINISEGAESANQIFKLARTVLDKNTSGQFRAAWMGGTEGERLLMFRGLLKTLGVGMGLNLSDEGRALLARIDDMSRELYSPSQTVLDVGDLARVLKTSQTGAKIGSPRGVRKKVQDAIAVTTAENKANRLIASVSAKVTEYTKRTKVLRADLKVAIAENDKIRISAINDELRIVGAKLGQELKIKKQLKEKMGQVADEELDLPKEFDIGIDTFNAGQTADGTPAAIRQYQLSDYRSLPNFTEWREVAQRGGVITNLFGKATNGHFNRTVADGWSFLNLYPRLGLRSSVEEVGMFGVIGGAEGFGYYLKGRLASRALRAATPAGAKTTVFGNEKIDKNLGIIYDNIFKITNKHYSKEELLAMANDPVLLNKAVADSMIKNRFKPGFFKTKVGEDYAKWSGDFAEFNGKALMDDINGSVINAERPMLEAEELSKSLKDFGPSVRFNVQNQEALKGLSFKGEMSEFSSRNDKAILNWLFELNNTVGKRNGKFGNIVLWNIGKNERVVIDKLVEYIKGPGNDIAKKFAIYSEGPEMLATKIFADATYALRDYSGKINMDLVNAIRNKGGMDDFNIDDLVKLDKPFARPETLMGREIVPLVGKSKEEMMYRIINSGYGWMGKQIALLDREPITLANYFMFRKQLKGTEAATKKNLMDNGLDEAGADSIARFSAHDTALNLARNRTLSFVDNGDVRTNLAYSLRTFGRYYRATEDFYRRIGRLAKYEKRAIVRLAILNQSFEDSGFIHEDERGQKYFTYPGDDLFAGAITKTLALAGITSYSPMPVRFGGYVKMLTPSLDPESWAPGISNPLASLALDGLTNLPYIGDYLTGFQLGPVKVDIEDILRGNILSQRSTDVPAWEKAAPANVKRVVNIFNASPENNESRFSSVVKAIKLVVSTGNGPTDSSQLDAFYKNVATQAKNVDFVKFIAGQMTVASIQAFGNKDIPKELINAGVYTYDAEYRKFLKKFDGQPDAPAKALVQFAKLYPSKLAYTNFASESTTFANFRKTIEAENFVRNNEKLLLDHSDAGSFFIPTVGTEDSNAYAYLKSKGYISNKAVNPKVDETKTNFIREVATTNARIAYYALVEEYSTKIAASQPGTTEKRYWQGELEKRKRGLLTAYPLLKVQIQPTSASNARREEVISDMKALIKENRAPNKDLADTFSAMISEYEKMVSTRNRVQGSSDQADAFKKELKADARDVIFKLSESSENAKVFFNSVIDPLIGD